MNTTGNRDQSGDNGRPQGDDEGIRRPGANNRKKSGSRGAKPAREEQGKRR